eukprot:TRINITY_DN33084_c0_g1_i1.p1 TRINITY_DN33084_c0_g1~~TRINITY_DN33084_c0_g1_i1.p1  ORF type:complete len:337 (-),score=59.59 TRINITY_DN33084_c0_g1_i1:46-1020(-)
MPRTSRPILDALGLDVGSSLQLQNKVDIDILRHGQYRRKLMATESRLKDPRLKEVEERRKKKQDDAALAELEAVANGEAVAMKAMEKIGSRPSAKTRPLRSEPLPFASDSKELTVQSSLQLKQTQDALEQVEKPKKKSKGKGDGKSKEGKQQSRVENTKTQSLACSSNESWNSSWPNAAGGTWDMRPAEPTTANIHHQSQEMWYAHGQSQRQQERNFPARYDRTPSPPSRPMSPTMEGYRRMAAMLQHVQGGQQGWQMQGGLESWGAGQGGGYYKQSGQAWDAPDDCSQQHLNRMLPNQLHLTQFEPIEYGVRGGGEMDEFGDM